jgi:hypothetical protein
LGARSEVGVTAVPITTTYPKVKPTDERYTPRWLLDAIVEALGPIAYDPCSPSHNPTGAARFTCLPDNGLETDWLELSGGGLVFVNSPFSNGNLLRWSNKVCDWHVRGCEIVQLTPIDGTTAWFECLFDRADIASALKTRPTYGKPASEESFEATAKQPAMLWYFGSRTKAWLRVMRDYAHCYVPGVL